MTTSTGAFPNIERAVVGWLKQELPGDVTVRNELPLDWNGDPGATVLVERVSGGGPGALNETAGSFDITVFADTVPNVWGVVPLVEKAMAELPATTFDDVVYSNTFGRVGYANKNIRRAVGGYDITARLR